MLFAGALARLSGDANAEAPSEGGGTALQGTSTYDDWEELPLDIHAGACLDADRQSALFGGTREDADGLLSQFIHVYPGLRIILAGGGEDDDQACWIGYNRELVPNAVLCRGEKNTDVRRRSLVSVPEGVFYLRGSSADRDAPPRAWLKSTALYTQRCPTYLPDLSAYTEITGLTFNQYTRNDENGAFDKDTEGRPSIGDLFFTPIGTEIILTFNNANIAPYIKTSENFKVLGEKNVFTGHYGFGFSWYYCKTPDICCALGACYNTVRGSAGPLTVEALEAAEPRLFIRFPGKADNTLSAAKIRTAGIKKRYERAFTVVHLTDIHGDVDSTHAACAYADQIAADFIAMTGDFVPNRYFHGYDVLHTIIKNTRTPVVYSLGNHDVASHTDKNVYSRSIEPIREHIQASEEHAYYYRDFQYGGETVRAISLYPFYNGAKTRQRGYYTQEQLQWLCQVMNDTPEGGHIFILRHFAHHKPVMSPEKAMFYDYEDDEDVDTWICMDEDPVKDIVDAYNERTSIRAEYKGYLKDDMEESVRVEFDFSGRPASEFVAYFVGHVHRDAIGYARFTRTRQAVLCSLCTTGVKGSAEYSSFTHLNTHRDYGTDSQIAFNVFTFDFQKKMIRVARAGNGMFQEREKTIMELPY